MPSDFSGTWDSVSRGDIGRSITDHSLSVDHVSRWPILALAGTGTTYDSGSGTLAASPPAARVTIPGSTPPVVLTPADPLTAPAEEAEPVKETTWLITATLFGGWIGGLVQEPVIGAIGGLAGGYRLWTRWYPQRRP